MSGNLITGGNFDNSSISSNLESVKKREQARKPKMEESGDGFSTLASEFESITNSGFFTPFASDSEAPSDLSNREFKSLDEELLVMTEDKQIPDNLSSSSAKRQASLVNDLSIVKRLKHCSETITDLLNPVVSLIQKHIILGKEYRAAGFTSPFDEFGKAGPVIVPDVREPDKSVSDETGLVKPKKVPKDVTSKLVYPMTTMKDTDAAEPVPLADDSLVGISLSQENRVNVFSEQSLGLRLGEGATIVAVRYKIQYDEVVIRDKNGDAVKDKNGKEIIEKRVRKDDHGNIMFEKIVGEISSSSVLLGDPSSPESRELLDVFITSTPGEPLLIRSGRIDTEEKRLAFEAILKELVFVNGCKTCVVRQLNSPKMDNARKSEVDPNAVSRDMVDNEHYHLAKLQQSLKGDKDYADCNVIHINLPRNQISLGKRLVKTLGGLGAWLAGYLFGENRAKRNNLEGLATYTNLTLQKTKFLCKGTGAGQSLLKLEEEQVKLEEIKNNLQVAVIIAKQVKQADKGIEIDTATTNLADAQVSSLQTELKQGLQSFYNEIVKAEFDLRTNEEAIRVQIARGKEATPELIEKLGNIKNAREMLTNQRRILVGQVGIKNVSGNLSVKPVLGENDSFKVTTFSDALVAEGPDDPIYKAGLDVGDGDTRLQFKGKVNLTFKEAHDRIIKIDEKITSLQIALDAKIAKEGQNTRRHSESKQIAQLLQEKQKEIQTIVEDIRDEIDSYADPFSDRTMENDPKTKERYNNLTAVLEEYDGLWTMNDFLYEVYTSQSMPKLQEMMAFDQLDHRLDIAQEIHCKTGVDRTAGDWGLGFAEKEMIAQEWKNELNKPGGPTLTIEQVRDRTLSRLADVATHYNADALIINNLMRSHPDDFKAFWHRETEEVTTGQGQQTNEGAKSSALVKASNWERLDMHLRMRTSFTSAFTASVGLTQICTGIVGNKGSDKINPNHQPYKLLLPFVFTKKEETIEGTRIEKLERHQIVQLDNEGKAKGPAPYGKRLFHLFAFMRGS